MPTTTRILNCLPTTAPKVVAPMNEKFTTLANRLYQRNGDFDVACTKGTDRIPSLTEADRTENLKSRSPLSERLLVQFKVYWAMGMSAADASTFFRILGTTRPQRHCSPRRLADAWAIFYRAQNAVGEGLQN